MGRPPARVALRTLFLHFAPEGRGRGALGDAFWRYGRFHFAPAAGGAASHRHSGRRCAHGLQAVLTLYRARLGALVRGALLGRRKGGTGRGVDAWRSASPHLVARRGFACSGGRLLFFRPSPHEKQIRPDAEMTFPTLHVSTLRDGTRPV